MLEATIYRIAGLRIVSDFPLFGPSEYHADATAEHQVLIRRAPVPKELPSAAARFLNVQYNGSEVLLDYPGVGRFLLRDGNEILVDPAPSSNERKLLTYLVGTVFGLYAINAGFPRSTRPRLTSRAAVSLLSASPAPASRHWLRPLPRARTR